MKKNQLVPNNTVPEEPVQYSVSGSVTIKVNLNGSIIIIIITELFFIFIKVFTVANNLKMSLKNLTQSCVCHQKSKIWMPR